MTGNMTRQSLCLHQFSKIAIHIKARSTAFITSLASIPMPFYFCSETVPIFVPFLFHSRTFLGLKSFISDPWIWVPPMTSIGGVFTIKKQKKTGADTDNCYHPCPSSIMPLSIMPLSIMPFPPIVIP